MNNASIRAIVESCMPPLCSDAGGDGCVQRIRNVPAVVQVYIPSKDMRTLRCAAPKRQQKSTHGRISAGKGQGTVPPVGSFGFRSLGLLLSATAAAYPFSRSARIGWVVALRCRDYRLTWAAVLLAFEVVRADRSLFRGWNVSWTLRCAAGVLARVLTKGPAGGCSRPRGRCNTRATWQDRSGAADERIAGARGPRGSLCGLGRVPCEYPRRVPASSTREYPTHAVGAACSLWVLFAREASLGCFVFWVALLIGCAHSFRSAGPFLQARPRVCARAQPCRKPYRSRRRRRRCSSACARRSSPRSSNGPHGE